ncbi:MAG TPA: DUF4249 domain-containing protein [Puia sp.]|nr:DUF4249 domain-containing protein [Puia sp.]
MTIRFLCLIFLCALFFSCEKAINFNLSASPSQLVVDASIENDKAPVVILSTSLNYFSQITPAILENSFVHNAVVTITSGNQTRQLKEYAVDTSGYSFFYYSCDTSNAANVFVGEFNTAYSLSITTNGKQYTATTNITSVRKKIDSLWWIPAPDNPDPNAVVLNGRVTDPAGFGDYIRYFTEVDNGPFLPGLTSVYDDQVTDGTTYDIEIDQGVDRNQSIDFSHFAYFNKGDSITVKFANIDKTTFDFWRTMEYDYQSIGNPFSSPTTVLGNISNGALGYFGGYAAQYISLKVPM